MKSRALSLGLFALLILAVLPSLAAPRGVGPSQEPEDVKSGWLQLTVVDEDGKPLRGVRVSLDPLPAKDGAERGERERYVTGENGFVEVTIPAGQKRQLTISHFEGDMRRDVISIDAMEEGDERPLRHTIYMSNNARFNGRVLDAVTKQPIVGAVVHRRSEPANLLLKTRGDRPIPIWVDAGKAVTVDDNGAFQVPAATWRDTTVTVAAPGYSHQSVTARIETGSEENAERQDIFMKRGTPMLVRVIDPPQGMELRAILRTDDFFVEPRTIGESVDVLQFVTRSKLCYVLGMPLPAADGDGGMVEYVVDGLPRGSEVDVVLFLRDEAGAPRVLNTLRRLTVPRDGEMNAVSMNGDMSGRIEVRALAEGDQPAAGATVWCCLADDDVSPKGFRTSRRPDFVATTDDDGRVTFPRLSPGTYHVAIAPQRRSVRLADPNARVSRMVEVKVTQNEVAPFVKLQLHKPLTIRCTFPEDQELRPMGYMRFDVTRLDDGAHTTVSFSPDRDNSLEIEPLVPGRYLVEAKSTTFIPNVTLRPVTILAGTLDAVLVPERFATLEVQVLDRATAEPIDSRRGYSITLRPADGSGKPATKRLIAKPRKKFHRLFAGEYDVEVAHKDRGIVGSLRVIITGKDALQRADVEIDVLKKMAAVPD